MDQRTFREFRDLIYQESGIALSDEKKQLLENRISKRLKALSIQSEDEYLRILETDLNQDELTELIDVVSTNLTFFYREKSHFEHLGNLLQSLRKSNKKELKIWCAAASTGEEPYTLSMIALESLEGSGIDFKVLATDICTKVLKRAMQGIYEEKQFEKMPPYFANKYFNRINTNEREVIDIVKSKVIFKRFNLAKYPYPLHGEIDIIFCRNVMIYFDVQTRAKCVNEFSKLLTNDGYFYLGQSENLLGITHSLKSIGTSIYRKEKI